jgi:serine/threonine-protein kinase RsbW
VALTAALFDLDLPAQLDSIPVILFEIEQCMRSGGFSDEHIMDMQLAVEEAVTNIVLHGYAGTPGPVTVHGEVDPGRATVEIADSAMAYNPLSQADPDVTAGLDERRIGGLGVFLIRRVTDDASYRFCEGKNVLRLVKLQQKTRGK